MAHKIEEFVKLAPAVWPGERLAIQPGNLQLFAPMGNGFGVFRQLPIREGDDFESIALQQDYFYGFHPHNGHPFSGAPVTEAGGGTVYFDEDCTQQDIEALLRLMGVRSHCKQFAAFVQEAINPQQRFLTQMRIVSGSALKYMFHIPDGPEFQTLTEQSLTVSEVIWKFIKHFRGEHEEGRYSVDGALAGDGDTAYESLAFGFFVENAYHAIYRIWTRAWLITK